MTGKERGSEVMMERPTVYNYLDYRQFLKEMVAYRKQKNPGFSYRAFSRLAGFKSPNFLQLVINGQRNLSNESVAKITRGFGLKKQERDFFENMVFMNQAKSHEEKDHYYKKMKGARGYTKINRLEKEQYEYFSRWY
ncbi:MAG: TIGR02147 family protein, partial [Thermodesulfobacteriota bacterium]